MEGIPSYTIPDGARTTWDLWQEEVVKVRRLSNAMKVLGVDPDKVVKDEKYDTNVYMSEVK
jgi:hypothetical protein